MLQLILSLLTLAQARAFVLITFFNAAVFSAGLLSLIFWNPLPVLTFARQTKRLIVVSIVIVSVVAMTKEQESVMMFIVIVMTFVIVAVTIAIVVFTTARMVPTVVMVVAVAITFFRSVSRAS